MSLTTGTRLGSYEIVGPLGAGGMGEVYRARDTKLHRDIALKVLPANAVANPTAKARLLREARLAASLNHPSIGTIHDVDDPTRASISPWIAIRAIRRSKKLAQ